MTTPDISNPILTGVRLAEAVGVGDGTTIRKISTDVDSDVIQNNGTVTFITAFVMLNRLDGGEFPTDVWNDLSGFLINDIKDRAIMLGFREEIMSGILGSFLKQNIWNEVDNKEVKLLNPERINSGYFNIAVGVGEAIYGLLKVAAARRFDGNYQMAKQMLTDFLLMQSEIASLDAQEA